VQYLERGNHLHTFELTVDSTSICGKKVTAPSLTILGIGTLNDSPSIDECPFCCASILWLRPMAHGWPDNAIRDVKVLSTRRQFGDGFYILRDGAGDIWVEAVSKCPISWDGEVLTERVRSRSIFFLTPTTCLYYFFSFLIDEYY
jgi:hypothetical protein